MSSLYISTGKAAEAAQAAAKLCFTPATQSFVESVGALAFAVTRVDADALWSPAHDTRTGIFAALGGRLAFEESEWAAAEKLPFTGGLACRTVLERFQKNPATLAVSLNGAGCVILADPRTNELHVITDRLGVFPMYLADGDAPLLCSHPDVLADMVQARGGRAEFDELTAVEFLATGTSVQPFTYYQNIQMLEPASHYVWKHSGEKWTRTRRTWWQPRYLTEPPSEDQDALTAQLADALRNAVKRRTLARLGKPGVLLSGGADSRVCVFGAETPEKVSCYTLFDEPNEELATARRIVAAAGAAHTPLPRDADYYALNAENSIRIAGGMWSFVDTHYTGMIPRFSAEKLGTVMTGCYVDYMLKGLAANRQHRRLFGRVLPLYDFAPFNFQFYSEHQPVAEPWQTQLQQRWQNRFPAHLRENYAANRLALEDLRLRPLAREADAAGRGILWRTLPWDPPIADTEVLAVFEKMSPASKVNGIVFGRAVAEVCGAAGRSIANNNYGTPVGASEQQRTAWFLWAVAKRKVRRALGLAPVRGGAVSTGSWPVWEYYLGHSPTVAQWWADVAPGERARFTGWLGEDPWKKSPAEAAEADAMQMARVLTLQRWLRQRGLTA